MLLMDLGPAEHQTEPVTSSSSLGQPWAHEPCTLRLFIPLSPSASLSFLLFPPFPLFVCYFQSFLSSLLLLYLFPLLRRSAPLLCSLHERRSGKCCNLVLISYLARDKHQRSKETTGILFEKCHRSFRTPIISLQKNKSIAIFNRHQITTQGTTS